MNLTWMFFDIFAGTERARKLHTERLQPSLTLYPVQLFSNTIRLFLHLPWFHKSAVEEDKMPQRRIRTLAGTSPCVQSRNSFGGQTQTAALLSMH